MVFKSRRKCSFKNSRNIATIDVYPDEVLVEADPGYSYNPVHLSLKDLKKIKECLLS